VLDSLLRLHNIWTSKQDGFKEIFSQPSFTSTLNYDKTANLDVRFEALVGTFTTVTKLTFSAWWHHILLKMFKVQFYAAFQKELELRLQEYPHLK
jgi:hypothetical protein